MEKKIIGERLGRVLTELKTSKQIESFTQLAKECKVSASAISEMTSGRNHVGHTFLTCLEEKYNVNREFVMKGTGSPFLDKKFAMTNKPIFLFNEFSYIGDTALFEGPNVDAAVSFLYDPDYKDCPVGIIISNDHLYPHYSPGDKLILKQAQDKDLVQFGKPYVILTEEHLFLRNIHKSELPGTWCLKAATKKYDDIELPLEKVKAFYQVKGCLHRVS